MNPRDTNKKSDPLLDLIQQQLPSYDINRFKNDYHLQGSNYTSSPIQLKETLDPANAPTIGANLTTIPASNLIQPISANDSLQPYSIDSLLAPEQKTSGKLQVYSLDSVLESMGIDPNANLVMIYAPDVKQVEKFWINQFKRTFIKKYGSGKVLEHFKLCKICTAANCIITTKSMLKEYKESNKNSNNHIGEESDIPDQLLAEFIALGKKKKNTATKTFYNTCDSIAKQSLAKNPNTNNTMEPIKAKTFKNTHVEIAPAPWELNKKYDLTEIIGEYSLTNGKMSIIFRQDDDDVTKLLYIIKSHSILKDPSVKENYTDSKRATAFARKIEIGNMVCLIYAEVGFDYEHNTYPFLKNSTPAEPLSLAAKQKLSDIIESSKLSKKSLSFHHVIQDIVAHANKLAIQKKPVNTSQKNNDIAVEISTTETKAAFSKEMDTAPSEVALAPEPIAATDLPAKKTSKNFSMTPIKRKRPSFWRALTHDASAPEEKKAKKPTLQKVGNEGKKEIEDFKKPKSPSKIKKIKSINVPSLTQEEIEEKMIASEINHYYSKLTATVLPWDKKLNAQVGPHKAETDQQKMWDNPRETVEEVVFTEKQDALVAEYGRYLIEESIFADVNTFDALNKSPISASGLRRLFSVSEISLDENKWKSIQKEIIAPKYEQFRKSEHTFTMVNLNKITLPINYKEIYQAIEKLEIKKDKLLTLLDSHVITKKQKTNLDSIHIQIQELKNIIKDFPPMLMENQDFNSALSYLKDGDYIEALNAFLKAFKHFSKQRPDLKLSIAKYIDYTITVAFHKKCQALTAAINDKRVRSKEEINNISNELESLNSEKAERAVNLLKNQGKEAVPVVEMLVRDFDKDGIRLPQHKAYASKIMPAYKSEFGSKAKFEWMPFFTTNKPASDPKEWKLITDDPLALHLEINAEVMANHMRVEDVARYVENSKKLIKKPVSKKRLSEVKALRSPSVAKNWATQYSATAKQENADTLLNKMTVSPDDPDAQQLASFVEQQAQSTQQVEKHHTVVTASKIKIFSQS